MILKELLDVIDPDRAYTDEYIEVADKNGNVTARFTTSCDLLEKFEGREVDYIDATEKGVIKVWLGPEPVTHKQEIIAPDQKRFKVNNVPDYASDYDYLVVTENLERKELWFYVAYNDIEKASQVSRDIGGFVVENEVKKNGRTDKLI